MELKTTSSNKGVAYMYTMPRTTKNAWEMFPKHRWVYETTRILDIEGISWSLFKDDLHQEEMPIFGAEDVPQSDKIYVAEIDGDLLRTDVAIHKGTIQWLQHYKEDPTSKQATLVNNIGNIELRIHAFIVRYFSKYNGMANFTTKGKHIVGVKLCPNYNNTSLYEEQNNDWINNVERIYQGKSWK